MPKPPLQSLPIWQVAPAILGALRSDNRLVLAAPTGSGKSTQVPQMLVDIWMGHKTDSMGRVYYGYQPEDFRAFMNSVKF